MEIYVEMEVDESDVKSIDLEDDEEIFIEMEVESDEDEEDYIHGDSQEDEDLNEENQINIEVEETIVSTIDDADEEVVNEIIKNLKTKTLVIFLTLMNSMPKQTQVLAINYKTTHY